MSCFLFLFFSADFATLERMRAVTPETKDIVTHFATTRWSLIRECVVANTAETNNSLSELCRIYWRPVFTFICRRGYSTADAQDLTQDFFILILEGKFLQTVDPQKGHFRSFLVRSLRNFLIDIAHRRQTQKRGGNLQFVSWETCTASAPQFLPTSHPSGNRFSEAAFFDFAWAAAIANEAFRQLELECESKAQRRIYETLSPYLTSERGDICYEDLAAALAVSQPEVKRLLHKFRARYRGILREQIAKTVDKSADIDDEIRYLCAILSAKGGP